MARILIWSPNYAPELIGIPPLVTDAAEWLATRGHEVDVVTAMPNYPSRRIDDDYRGAIWSSERRNGVAVSRSWLRVRPGERFLDKVLYELSFAALSLPRAVRRAPRADVVLCVVPTLTHAVIAGALARVLPGPRLVLWLQDLVLPAALALNDVGPAQQRILRSVARLERFAASAADRVLVCSPSFRNYLVGSGVQPDRVETLPNWVDVDRIKPMDSAAGTRATTTFLYAGNLGYTQGFETLIDAARLAGDDTRVEIVGDGNAAPHVRRLAATTTNVRVRPSVGYAEFPALLASADAHVVVQRRVSAGANLPSKINSYLASGRPIVAAIGEQTSAAQLLRASGGALLVPPESPSDLAAAMMRLHEEPRLRVELGRASRTFAVAELGRDVTLQRLEAVLVG